MAGIEVEVFREDVDQLSAKLWNLLADETEHLNEVDRSIIVAAALANVACGLDDSASVVQEAVVLRSTEGVCGRLRRIAVNWRG